MAVSDCNSTGAESRKHARISQGLGNTGLIANLGLVKFSTGLQRKS